MINHGFFVEASQFIFSTTQNLCTYIEAGAYSPFIFSLTIFILSCFIGYFVVWRVTPALHAPLMAVTNAISGVIIIGAIISLGNSSEINLMSILSFFAIIIASINIFGGFSLTSKMLSMFTKSKK